MPSRGVPSTVFNGRKRDAPIHSSFSQGVTHGLILPQESTAEASVNPIEPSLKP
jgi:hypothetical protein